ncbi:hypothetical protein HDZ31DRAFT_65511 [Schizophyllum fasciatum]
MSQPRTRHRVLSSASSPLARRKHSARNLHGHERAATFTARTPRTASRSPDSARVLVPLYPNLRRVPTRQSSMAKAFARVEPPVRAGGKRKREGPANENHAQGRSTRGDGRTKRRKALHGGRMEYSSDEDELSSMEVDDAPAWSISDGSDTEEDEDQSSDDYLIHSATPQELQRLRKNDLVRLYHAAGLSEDAESLTKPDVITAIVAARDDDDDDAAGPPSSPPRDGLSDYSSDDGGNVAADEDDDDVLDEPRTSPMYLRRRATYQVLDSSVARKKPKTNARSMSMGNMLPTLRLPTRSSSRGSAGSSNGSFGPRRRTTSRGSSSSQQARPRTRKTSNNVVEPMTPVATSKGKGKSVEFETPKTPSAGRAKAKPSGEESDLTELDELEEQIANPSPRRLRSKDKENMDERRVTPMRKAKGKIITLREDSDTTDSDGGELPAAQAEEQADTEEVDELMTAPASSTSTLTPPQSAGRLKRSPMKKRLRSRQHPVEQADDGDDELTDLDEESVDGEHALDMPTPRKLRNGKVVGEEADEIEDAEEAGNVSEETIGESSDEGSTLSEEVEAGDGAEEEEEAMEQDDVDLTAATAKTLTRLRKDDLVRLCETRDLDASGTKPQLAEALLQWRDTHAVQPSPSSTGTVRPPSTIKRKPGKRNRSDNGSISPPVLERSHRVHLDEPKTPPLSPTTKEPEPELELDLEALGLNDREIPPEKITKLEKIGSGGFKDVFIGKWGKRKVAISEFRGQLTEMDIKELKLLGGFNHENIVRFFGVSIPENSREIPVMIISELCTNGDLFDYIRNVDAPPLHRILRIMLSVARGLEYLHLRKPSVIHRDCKSSNILITRDGSAKIADFGLAKVKQSTRSMVRSLVGTVNWQAPELWHAHPKYNHKVDVFSCALVYWEMMQWHLSKSKRKYPWEGMNEHAIYEAVGTKRQRPSVKDLRKHYCPEIVDLMERMWAQEPGERPTMSQVVTEVESILKQYKR